MTITYHDLDYGKKYRLTLDYNAEQKQLSINVDDKSRPWKRLTNALENQLMLYGHKPDESGTTNYSNRIHRRKENNKIVFSDVPQDFALKLDNHFIGAYHVDHEGATAVLHPQLRRDLLSADTRRMGTFHNIGPYPYKEEDAELIEHAKKAVFTDFHTHSSGHISPDGLMSVALKHEAYYPTALLEQVGIAVDYQRFPKNIRKSIPRVPFPPRDTPNMPAMVDGIPASALNEDELHTLKLRMAMPGDRQSTYSKMENDAYRFRYPLTKNDDLMADSLRQMAREYKQQGIHYAEIACVNWLDNPKKLEIIHRTMQEIENDPEFKNLTMRFQIGIPRGFSDAEIDNALERAKVATASPYVVGVNFLGHEVTKTQSFKDSLHNFCAWANEHRPGLTIAVHAGENAKNPGNVEEVIDLGLEFEHLNFAIGHGLYGLTKSAIAKAQKMCADKEHPRLRIESNPDSVLALNNIDDFNEIPFTPMVDAGLPFVLGSDSAGTYGTSAEQLGLAAYHGGLREKGFELLKQNQEILMRNQITYSNRLAETIPKWETLDGKMTFVEKVVGELNQVPPPKNEKKNPPRHPDEIRSEVRTHLGAQEVQLIDGKINDTPGLHGKTPITLVGAGGESWAQVNPIAQKEVTAAVDLLAHVIDPEKAYFVQGRSKKIGLSYAANNALSHANEELAVDGKRPFHSVGIIVDRKFNMKESYRHLTHLQWVEQQYLDIAEALAQHTVEKQGIMIAAGGLAFTRDIILEADQQGMLENTPENKKMMMLFENANGASADKAKMLDPQYRVQTGIDIVKKLHENRPELFRSDFEMSKLDALYEQSLQRADDYGYEAPAESGKQTIQNVQPVQPKKRGLQ